MLSQCTRRGSAWAQRGSGLLAITAIQLSGQRSHHTDSKGQRSWTGTAAAATILTAITTAFQAYTAWKQKEIAQAQTDLAESQKHDAEATRNYLLATVTPERQLAWFYVRRYWTKFGLPSTLHLREIPKGKAILKETPEQEKELKILQEKELKILHDNLPNIVDDYKAKLTRLREMSEEAFDVTEETDSIIAPARLQGNAGFLVESSASVLWGQRDSFRRKDDPIKPGFHDVMLLRLIMHTVWNDDAEAIPKLEKHYNEAFKNQERLNFTEYRKYIECLVKQGEGTVPAVAPANAKAIIRARHEASAGR